MANEEESHADSKLSKLRNSLKIKMDENRAQKEALKDSRPTGPVMYRVPDMLRGQNEHAYNHTTVSIGPLHMGKECLQAMEGVELSYMCYLFERAKNFEETQTACMEAMLKQVNLVRTCYEEPSLYESGKAGVSQSKTEDVRLAEIMVIDGCFIIELIYKNCLKDYDPILWNPFKYYAVQHDLVLLENQIPFFVLQDLFSMTVGRIPQNSNRHSVTRCLVEFFGDMIGIENGGEKQHYTSPYNILHFLHIHYVPSRGDENFPSESSYEEPPKLKYSATELGLAGVKLKAAKNRNHFDMKFSAVWRCCSCFYLCRRGRFEVPPFSIYESTEPFLRNVIAFEQCCPWIQSYFTAHAFLMDILIDTPEDVRLFEEAGVIFNYLGSSEAVSQLFNGICKKAVPRHFLYGAVYKQAMDFCNPVRVSTGKLKREYFANPWSGILVIAAASLFLLAFLQALYSILSYVHRK